MNLQVLKDLAATNNDLIWASIVSLIVSSAVSYYFKRKETRLKVEVEYEYEQKKNLRHLIGKYHGRLLHATNSLNYRMWNLYANHANGWLDAKGDYKDSGYYFVSFAYRYLNVCALIRQIEHEAICLDTRIAEKMDYTFLNYMAVIQWIITDVALFKGIKYDQSIQMDHFFADSFRHYSEKCYKNDDVVTYDEFKSSLLDDSDLREVFSFFDGLKKNENRLRWDRIVALHLILLAFINTFGYKRQYSKQHHFNDVAKEIINSEIYQNLLEWIPRHDLENDKEIKKVISAIKMSANQRCS